MTYTKQQTFNKVVRHLRRQGVQSSRTGRCLYRGPDDTKCAVGCLIPDELYQLGMEGCSSMGNPMSTCLRLLGHDVGLCGNLQRAHDSYMPGGRYEEQGLEWALECIAEKHGLNVPE